MPGNIRVSFDRLCGRSCNTQIKQTGMVQRLGRHPTRTTANFANTRWSQRECLRVLCCGARRGARARTSCATLEATLLIIESLRVRRREPTRHGCSKRLRNQDSIHSSQFQRFDESSRPQNPLDGHRKTNRASGTNNLERLDAEMTACIENELEMATLRHENMREHSTTAQHQQAHMSRFALALTSLTHSMATSFDD